ncbi:MAG TPA: GMC family oxidoreductase N-terminal domain-containing protein [Dehalococcoidia bacterium]|nr:GMC family oxidoreductase N-terminal domain-containing protein [Dehalococcoidia bacterium]
MALIYDDVIVGAGSSGSVLASRLSEDPGRSVLLLEAGPDFASVEETPQDLIDGRNMSVQAHDWGFMADAVPGRPITYPRGKVTGGSSAVNATVALRGVPADYDEWAAWGNDGWSWQDVLPYFRKLEDDEDEHGDLHGTGGPIPIRRWKPGELRPPQQAYFNVLRRLGFPEVTDHNHPDSTGAGIIPQNQRNFVRMSAAIGYLAPARHRINLTIKPNCLVDRVLFEGKRAIGVELECGGVRQQVFGRRITLSAGAVASPAILLRSGIGPAADLRALGIEPLVDAPVGTRLNDHPLAFVFGLPRPGVCDRSNPFIQVMLRYTAPGSDVFNDMQLYFGSQFDVLELAGAEAMAMVGAQIVVGAGASLQRPLSRGRLTLASRDPHEQPKVDLNFCSDAQGEDMRRMVEGVRLGYQVVTSPELAPFVERVALLSDEAVASNEALSEYVRMTVGTTFHPVSTAPMGPESDANAVVDPRCRVRGVENLRVVDASVMPNIVRCNTNLTCMMIGERVADWMKAEQPQAVGGLAAAPA